jgi:hypothetical protein
MPTTEGIKDRFDGVERRRFPALVALGAGLGVVVVVIVAFVADAGLAWPLLILFALCLAVAVVYRLIAGSSRDDADHTDSFPKQPATRSRPLGDTPEAHDELSPHDIPLYSPARRAAEQQAAGPRVRLAGTGRAAQLASAGRPPATTGSPNRTRRTARRSDAARRSARPAGTRLTRRRADDGRPLAPQPVPRGYRRRCEPRGATPRQSRNTSSPDLRSATAGVTTCRSGRLARLKRFGKRSHRGRGAMKFGGVGSARPRLQSFIPSIYRRGSERSTTCATSSCFSTTP